MKNLVIVLVGANFVHGVISPKRTPQVSLGLHDKRCEPRHRRGAFCRRLGLYDFANSGHLAPHGSPLSGVKRTWPLRESAFAVAFGSKADMPYCGAHVCF